MAPGVLRTQRTSQSMGETDREKKKGIKVNQSAAWTWWEFSHSEQGLGYVPLHPPHAALPRAACHRSRADITFVPEIVILCDHSEIHIHCPGISPTKVHGIRSSTGYPGTTQSAPEWLSWDCILALMAEKAAGHSVLAKP